MADYTVGKWRDLTQYECAHCPAQFLWDPKEIRKGSAKRDLFEHLFDAHSVLIEPDSIPNSFEDVVTPAALEPITLPVSQPSTGA